MNAVTRNVAVVWQVSQRVPNSARWTSAWQDTHVAVSPRKSTFPAAPLTPPGLAAAFLGARAAPGAVAGTLSATPL